MLQHYTPSSSSNWFDVFFFLPATCSPLKPTVRKTSRKIPLFDHHTLTGTTLLIFWWKKLWWHLPWSEEERGPSGDQIWVSAALSPLPCVTSASSNTENWRCSTSSARPLCWCDIPPMSSYMEILVTLNADWIRGDSHGHALRQDQSNRPGLETSQKRIRPLTNQSVLQQDCGIRSYIPKPSQAEWEDKAPLIKTN